MKKSSLALLVSFTFLTSMISTPAQAAIETFPCGTSGNYTVTNGVLTGHSACVGDLNVDSSVLEIANDVFRDHTGLAAITIPGSVVTVGENAFSGATATSLTLSEGLIEIKAGAFASLGSGASALDISLPDSLTTLGDAAFQQNYLGKIVIGDSLTNIPQQAFYNNFGGGAHTVVFGSSVSNIAPVAFLGYQGEILNFPDSLETIDAQAFAGATNVTTVLLPASLSSIAVDAFEISPTATRYCGSNPDIINYAFPAPNIAKVCGNLVKFDRNGANNNQPAHQFSSTSANLTDLAWVRQDYSFASWTANQDGTGARYSSGGSFPFTSSFTILYAQWQVLNRVIFDSNTGVGGMNDQLSSVAANLNVSQFEKCGFDFNGWSTNQNGGPTTYQDQASFPFVDAETRLYAQWRSRPDANRVKTDANWNPVNGNSGSNAFTSGSILTMVVNPVSGELFAGGTFTNVAGMAEADYLAKWDGSRWSALGSNGSGDGALAQSPGSGEVGVFDLAFDSFGNLFVTGKFSISGVASHVAKWDGASWSSVGTGLEFENSGRAIAVDSRNQIYVGGHFANVAGDSQIDHLAKWDGTAWRGVGDPQLEEVVKSIDIGLNDSVYIGTFETNIAGIPQADYIAKWNGSVWAALGGTNGGNGQLRGMPRSIKVDSRSGVDVVYVGTLERQIRDTNGDNVQLGYFVKWDGTQWGQALPDVLISDDYVSDIALAPGGGLVVAGWFRDTDDEIGDSCNTNHKSLVYFDGTHTYGLGVNGSGPSFDRSVDSVVFNKAGQLVAGGIFLNAGGNSSASRIAITSLNFQPRPSTSNPSYEYLGPEVLSISGGKAYSGDLVTIHGKKLDLIDSVSIDGIAVNVSSKASQSITIQVPVGLTDGIKSIVFLSSFGKLEYIRALEIKSPVSYDNVVPVISQKITLVTTKNSVVIYVRGYQGQSLKWKIAGKWQTFEVTESYQVFRRATIWTDYGIRAYLFMDQELLVSKSLTTK